LISFLYPAQNKALIDELAKRKATVFAMDCIPRISRAQVRTKSESEAIFLIIFQLYISFYIGIRRSKFDGKHSWLQSCS
jgi:hypothetical protein